MGLFGPPDIKKLSDKNDFPGLVKALAYRAPAVRAAAAEALGVTGATLNGLLAAYFEVAGAPGLSQAGDLIARIRSAMADPTLHATSMADLARLKAVALQPLVSLLADGSAEVRRAAANALCGLGSPTAADPLHNLLSDPDQGVRAAAEEARASLAGAQEAEGTVISMAKYSEYFVKLARTLNTANPDEVFAHHAAFCEKCGLHYSKEALTHLNLFGPSGDFGGNLSVRGRSTAGDAIRGGLCPNCGHDCMRVVRRNVPDHKTDTLS